MNGGKKQGGYTIVEVLVFMAITGVLFVVAFFAISGKQAQAQFTQSVRDFESSINDLINDVSTGFYPNNTSIKCVLSGSLGSQVTFVNGGSQPGTNQDCTFIGKVLQFNSAPTSHGFNIITVAGTRISDQNQEANNIPEAHPVAVVSPTTTPVTNLTAGGNLNNGLLVTDLIVYDPSSGSISRPGAIGFFTSFPKYNASAIAGALNTDVINIPSTSLTDSLDVIQPGPSLSNTINRINQLDTASYITNPRIVICLEQDGLGSNGRRAALIIGNNGRANTAELHIADVVQAVDGVDNNNSDGSPVCAF